LAPALRKGLADREQHWRLPRDRHRPDHGVSPGSSAVRAGQAHDEKKIKTPGPPTPSPG